MGCSNISKTEKEIENIPIDLEILRFDKVFGKATINDLPDLKNSYPLFFPKQYHDSIWIKKINDTLQRQLYSEVEKKYPTNEIIEDELISLFQHIEYYFPTFEVPSVVTLTSDVDYKNKALLADSLLIISLDTYLGGEHPFYEGIPKYISQNMNESQITQDVANLYSERMISMPRDRTFLATMIYYGKQLYLKDIWLPSSTDPQKIGYSVEEYNWILENETEIWRYFIENEILFSTDQKLLNRFINPAPFSKFYLEIDNDSPGSTGKYIGWQIVRSFMDRNSISVSQLMIMDADELFEKSKYKPKK